MTENGEISQMNRQCAVSRRMGYAVRMHSLVTITARPKRLSVEQSICAVAPVAQVAPVIPATPATPTTPVNSVTPVTPVTPAATATSVAPVPVGERAQGTVQERR